MKVSLQDFGFHQPNAPEINTPRSLEACRREGIQPCEIVKVSFEEYQKKYKLSNLDAKGIETYYKHFEEKREEKYRDLVKQRHIVIEDEKNGNFM